MVRMMGDTHMDLGMNSRRRTRSNDNLGSRAITTTSLASSMLLASQDAASSARHSRASETAFMASHRLHLEVQKPSGSGRYTLRRRPDSSAQAGGCCSVGAGAAHGATASAHIRMVVRFV